MKAVILAGGLGTRISEESHLKPKPMIEIGGMPILWHIMKYYSCYDINDFIICAGYKAQIIKEFFANYYLHRSDITFDFSRKNEITVHNNVAESWRVTIVDTGLNTMTGGRIKRIQNFVHNETFMLTYGDGVSDVDIDGLLSFHKKHGKTATITSVQPGGKFGVLEIEDGGKINTFVEKSKEDGGWISGGFMVFEPSIFNYLDGDDTALEREPFEKIAKEGGMFAYKHGGFWQCMDTLRDRVLLDDLIEKEKAPWIKW
jgi:glucose-1-phosphate cytidylyltransferase